jgi:hypothetical protein
VGGAGAAATVSAATLAQSSASPFGALPLMLGDSRCEEVLVSDPDQLGHRHPGRPQIYVIEFYCSPILLW